MTEGVPRPHFLIGGVRIRGFLCWVPQPGLLNARTASMVGVRSTATAGIGHQSVPDNLQIMIVIDYIFPQLSEPVNGLKIKINLPRVMDGKFLRLVEIFRVRQPIRALRSQYSHSECFVLFGGFPDQYYKGFFESKPRWKMRGIFNLFAP